MVSIRDLKLDNVRKEIEIEVDGIKEYIHIFNAFDDQREGVLEKLKEIQDLDISGEKMIEETYKYLYYQFTDIDINSSITESINNPKLEMIEIRKEIDSILDEIQYEFQVKHLLKLNNIRNAKIAELNFKRLDEIRELEKELNIDNDLDK